VGGLAGVEFHVPLSVERYLDVTWLVAVVARGGRDCDPLPSTIIRDLREEIEGG
jgi:hypothetical protein